MTLVVATLLLFAAGPFVLWPLIRTPEETLEQPAYSSSDQGSGGAE
jgi:hypothetical protein